MQRHDKTPDQRPAHSVPSFREGEDKEHHAPRISPRRTKSIASYLLGSAFAAAFAGGILVWTDNLTKAASASEDQPHVTVLAAPGLQEPVTLITREYSRQKNVTVTAYFLPAADYITPLSDGKNADLMITDTPILTGAMKQRGLLDVYSVTNLVRDNIVLARPKSAPHDIPENATFAQAVDKTLSSGKPFFLVKPSERSDLGKHTAKILERAAAEAARSQDDDTIPDIRRMDDPADVADALAKTKDGAALLYRSEVIKNNRLREETEAPRQYYNPAILQSAVIAGENMEQARDLNAFLQAPEQLELFYRCGYSPAR